MLFARSKSYQIADQTSESQKACDKNLNMGGTSLFLHPQSRAIAPVELRRLWSADALPALADARASDTNKKAASIEAAFVVNSQIGNFRFGDSDNYLFDVAAAPAEVFTGVDWNRFE